MSANFADKLLGAIEQKGAPVCVGIDPRYDRLPEELKAGRDQDERQQIDAIAQYCDELLPILAPHVPVVKPQIALFERLGWRGLRALETVVARCRERGRLVVLDAKRGEVYGQLFEAGQTLKPLTPPSVLTHEAAEVLTREVLSGKSAAALQVSLIGTGAPLIAARIGGAALALISEASFQPDAAEVARLASRVADPASAPPDPLYLRAPDAKVPSRNPLD